MKELVKSTFPYFKRFMGILVLCVFLGLTQMIILLIEPQIISLIVDKVINPALGNDPVNDTSIFNFLIDGIAPDRLWTILGVLIAAFLFFVVLYFITFYIRWNIAHYFTLKGENNLRRDVLKKINSMGPAVLKDYSTGELITIVNSDTSRIRDLYVASIPFIIDNLFYIVMAVYFLARLNLFLMILPLLTLVIYAFITRGFLKVTGKLYDQMWVKGAALNNEAQESIYGIRTIKAYARENFRSHRFAEKSEEVRDFYCKFGTTRYRFFMLYDSIDQILMVISMALSIYLATRFKMTSGEFTSFLTYLLMIANCFVSIIFIFSDIQGSVVSGKRLFGLVNKKDETLESYGDAAVSAKPDIEVKDISIQADDKMLLDHVTVSIPYGKKIGIMGKTGSGKSVFLRALQAFDELTEGDISINGNTLKHYNKIEIARAYSYAMQDVFLFSNTIASNIAFYKPDSDKELIDKCGALAEVAEFVGDFPDGYETIVGEKGFGLSGGQKQRVAIARALLKDAPVIVLDDCTSALDVETESKIFKNLKNYCDDKTLLIATHRATAIKDCDEILFFEDGRIAERGTHDELMKLDGRYAGIYRRQVEGEVFVSE